MIKQLQYDNKLNTILSLNLNFLIGSWLWQISVLSVSPAARVALSCVCCAAVAGPGDKKDYGPLKSFMKLF